MNRNYYSWLVADTSSQLGGAIRAFALPLLVVIAEGSSTKAGVLSSMSALIAGSLAIVGGYLTDRYDRRSLMITSSSITLLIFIGAVVWLRNYDLTWTFLLVLATLTSIRSGLFSQVSNVYLRNIVDSKTLPTAMSYNQARDGAVEIVGGPISGFLLKLSIIHPFIAEIVLSSIALFATLNLPKDTRLDRLQPSSSGSLRSKISVLLKDAFSGGSVIYGNPVLYKSMLVSVIFFPLLNGLIFLLVLDTVNTGKGVIAASTLNASVAVGVIVGAIFSAKLVQKYPSGKVILTSLLMPIPFAFGALIAPQFGIKLISLLFLLSLLPAANAAFGGFVMLIIPDASLGRVFAFIQVFGLLVAPIVSFYVGYGLEHWGIFVTGGILIVAMGLISIVGLDKTIRNIPVPANWEEYAKVINKNVKE